MAVSPQQRGLWPTSRTSTSQKSCKKSKTWRRGWVQARRRKQLLPKSPLRGIIVGCLSPWATTGEPMAPKHRTLGGSFSSPFFASSFQHHCPPTPPLWSKRLHHARGNGDHFSSDIMQWDLDMQEHMDMMLHGHICLSCVISPWPIHSTGVSTHGENPHIRHMME